MYRSLMGTSLYVPVVATCTEQVCDHYRDLCSYKNKVEPPHDKTKKMSMRPAKTLISLGIRLRWAHTHFVGFVMSRLKFQLFVRLIEGISEYAHSF